MRRLSVLLSVVYLYPCLFIYSCLWSNHGDIYLYESGPLIWRFMPHFPPNNAWSHFLLRTNLIKLFVVLFTNWLTRSFRIQITHPTMWSAPTKVGAPYNFGFIKFSPNTTVEAAEPCKTLFRDPLTQGVWVWGQIPAMNLSPIEEYPHAKSHWDWSSGLDFYSGHTRHTHSFIY